MAFVDRKGNPQSLLPAGASRKKKSEAIGTLLAYSFIIQRGMAMTFDLHRLVHLATRSWLQKEGAFSRWSRAAIARLAELFPDDEHENRAQWQILLPHAAFVLRLDIVAEDDSRRLGLAWKYAMSLYSDGRCREAEVPFDEVFRARKKVLAEEHSDTLTSMNNLALTWKEQSRHEGAIRLMIECVRLRMHKPGADHLSTLSSIRTLNGWKMENLDIT